MNIWFYTETQKDCSLLPLCSSVRPQEQQTDALINYAEQTSKYKKLK